MKHGVRILTLFAAAVLWLVPGACAQFCYTVVKAEIPFPFTVAGRDFPAGQYSMVSDTPHVLSLRDDQGRVLATVMTYSVRVEVPPDSPKLRFYVEGERYILAEAWRANDETGYQFYHHKKRTELAKQPKMETVSGIDR